MTAASVRLQVLGRELARVYLEHTRPRAILLTGSAAIGEADFYSDLDLIVYYDALPDEAAFAATRTAAGARDPSTFAPPTDEAYPEYYYRDGVQCQLAHETIASWEAELRTVLVDLDVESPVQKAISGLFEGIPLHGEELIARWRDEARYPDTLARAMVERYWRFFPIWHVEERLAARDATLWRQQVLVESAYNLLGVLAGLNRVWFTSFQFKRAHAFAAQLEIAPAGIVDRLDALFSADPRTAVAGLEALVAETQALLGEHMPDFDATLRRGPGTRELPWTLEAWANAGRHLQRVNPRTRRASPPGSVSVTERVEDRDHGGADDHDEDRREDEGARRQHHLHRRLRCRSSAATRRRWRDSEACVRSTRPSGVPSCSDWISELTTEVSSGMSTRSAILRSEPARVSPIPSSFSTSSNCSTSGPSLCSLSLASAPSKPRPASTLTARMSSASGSSRRISSRRVRVLSVTSASRPR